MPDVTTNGKSATGDAAPHMPPPQPPIEIAVDAFKQIAAVATKAMQALQAPSPLRGEAASLVARPAEASVASASLLRPVEIVAPTADVTGAEPSSHALSAMALRTGEALVWQSSGGNDPRLSHSTGVPSGVNWECRWNVDKQNVYAQFGPYLPVASGSYRVEFDLWSQSCWATIEVTKNSGQTIIWTSHTHGDPNPTGGRWQTFSSPNLVVNTGDVLEFRVSWHTDILHNHSLLIGQTRLFHIASTAAHGDRMNSGEVLRPGSTLSSANGNYRLALQGDGNLVLYSGSSALWASNTAGKPVSICTMQADGNLVLYDAAGTALWATNTNGSVGAHLVVQDDGNVVIYRTNNTPAWASNTVHTVGADTLIYRSRLKRWTNIPFVGTKGNDVIMVPLPAGSTLKSVYVGPIGTDEVNPNLASTAGSSVGNAWAGARVTRITSVPGFVAVSVHWWFDAFSAAEYSVSVWVTGPHAYPVEDAGTLCSANMDQQIIAQAGKWFENNEANLIAAAVAVAVACADIASLGTATPVTIPALVAAIGAAATAGAKIALSPGN